MKLASELQRRQTGKTFYILDEPTTGLHFDDVRQLLEVLQRLVDAGNTVLVIEHNLDIIKALPTTWLTLALRAATAVAPSWRPHARRKSPRCPKATRVVSWLVFSLRTRAAKVTVASVAESGSR